jgi:carboxylesterase 2
MLVLSSGKIASVAVLIASGTLSSAALYDHTISTKYGEIQGHPAFNSTPEGNLTNWQNVAVWKGIPFAASTAGDNRWKAPQPASHWNSTLDASAFGPICPATKSFGLNGDVVSEDCLSLNIWSAAKKSDAKLPVVMWSTPAESTASDALFDGSGMASQGVVFVNYNYRTGAFGWM